MLPKNYEIVVTVPHRISGFFEIVDEIKGVKITNPEKIGSRGAGFNLNYFGRTKIIFEKINEYEKSHCQIYINDKEMNEKAETSSYILNYINRYSKKPMRVKVYHSFDLPVGCGYGASGSGALGLSYGLNQLLSLGFSNYEIGRLAHIAEVINKTGLGTVCGQLAGGLCMLKEPGYPCNYEKIKIPNHLRIVCGSFGKLYTKSILTDTNLNLRIKNAGRKALCKLIHDPTIITFIKASNDFVNDTDMLNILNLNKVQELIQNLNQLDILGASMNQLGKSVYAVCKKQNENKVLEVFECYSPEIKIFSSSIRENNKILIE